MLLFAQPLSYTVSWLGVPVVDVTLTKVESDTACRVEFRARTRPWFDHLYSVDNRYCIWVEPGTGRPVRYEKQVLERGRADHLWARYEQNPWRVVYGNGLERPWQEDAHNLFSALIWAQRHEWQAGEDQVLLVEVEGAVWQVIAECSELIPAEEPGGPITVIEARFERQEYGEPVLSTTDILSFMLPGVGHRLKLGLDQERDQVKWAEFGSRPFMVRAELGSAPEHP
ncbi:MAG: DUF3108 domain-containing protein [Candidatus Neomarinimicrobiota bacterium]